MSDSIDKKEAYKAGVSCDLARIHDIIMGITPWSQAGTRKGIIVTDDGIHLDSNFVKEHLKYDELKQKGKVNEITIDRSWPLNNELDGEEYALWKRLVVEAEKIKQGLLVINICDVNLFKHCNKVQFCDHPDISPLELGIFLGMAQQEREFISQRTKQGMAKSAKQAGNPHLALKTEDGLALIEKNHELIKKNRKTRADRATANVKAFAAIRYMAGTLREKADYLNRNGFVTTNNKTWQATSVSRLIARYEETVDVA